MRVAQEACDDALSSAVPKDQKNLLAIDKQPAWDLRGTGVAFREASCAAEPQVRGCGWALGIKILGGWQSADV